MRSAKENENFPYRMKRYTQNELDELANILKKDGVISVPTDTVYGICVRINSVTAYNNLINIKNRPSDKSFPVMCADEEQIENIALVDEKAKKLIHAFMPGPITLVLNKRPEAFEYINNAGSRTTSELAVRMAPSKVLEELIYKVGCPIFMTSANMSGKSICNNLDEIEKTFSNLNGMLEGNVSFGEASTIVDCTSDEIKIQRQGPISLEQIMEVLEN